METSVALSSQEHVGVRRFLEGDLVEVRQREKGLRGSWHPAVVVGVKIGRRVVEYDELLTDDHTKKLTESIPVRRYSDGQTRSSSRQQQLKPPALLHPTKLPTELLRPRPPPQHPDLSKVRWSKGLSVDCFYQDAWWEGVLTEAVGPGTSNRHKQRVDVWFPAEEDTVTMPVKNVRVGQQWDEVTGTWHLKGFVDLPRFRRGNKHRSAGGKGLVSRRRSRGLRARTQRTKSPDGMDISVSLEIDENANNSRRMECTQIIGNGTTAPPDDGHNGESVRPYLPTESSDADSAHQESAEPASTGAGMDLVLWTDSTWQQSGKSRVLRTRSLDSFRPRPLVEASLQNPSLEECLPPPGEVKESDADTARRTRMEADSIGNEVEPLREFPARGPVPPPAGGKVEAQNSVGGKPTLPTLSSNGFDKDKDWGDGGDDQEGEGPSKPESTMDDKNRQRLMDAGWLVTQKRKNGRCQWHYKMPNGWLLGSLGSAMEMLRRMNGLESSSSGDDENPTLIALKSPISGGRSSRTFSKGFTGALERLPKASSRRDAAASNPLENEEGQQMDELQPTPGPTPTGPLVIVDSVSQPLPRLPIEIINGTPGGGPSTPDIPPGFSTPATPDIPPGFSTPAYLNFKRNAVEDEKIALDGELNELYKRRRLEDSCQASEPLPGLQQPFLPNGFSDEGRGQGPVDLTSGMPPELSLFNNSNHHRNDTRLAAELARSVDDGQLMLDSISNVETRASKKRAFLKEATKLDEASNGNIMDIRSPGGGEAGARSDDGLAAAVDHDGPRRKKGRFISNSVSSTPGKSRKSLAIVKESSRKKGSTPHKGGSNSKQVKKGATPLVKKSAKKGKKGRGKPGRPGFRLEVLLSPDNKSGASAGEGELSRKRTLLSWLIDNGTVEENARVRYLHRKDLRCMLEGSLTREGVLCDHCGQIVTLSVFEAHAGSKLHRPSANIYLHDGRSLSVCQVEALKNQSLTDSRKRAEEPVANDQSDDTCGICADGGNLVCCDHCPSTFHTDCMGLQDVPDGDWFCPNCRCAGCGDVKYGGDPATFNELTVLSCDQCECDFHVKCLRALGTEVNGMPEGRFFCRRSCERIFQRLRRLVGVTKQMESGYTWTLLRSIADDPKTGPYSEDSAEMDSKLSIALSVMQECFRPMVDARSKLDIITHVMYNRRCDVRRLDYKGFYAILLENANADELISVACIRVHGARVAEMPLIGTRFQYRRKGMCRRLMSAIEDTLKSLGVERLVLPAVSEMLDTWVGAFGFRVMDENEKLQLIDLNFMTFPGTATCYKDFKFSSMEIAQLDDVPDGLNEAPVLLLEGPPIGAAGQGRCAPVIVQPAQKPDVSAVPPPAVIVKRGRGRPPKIKPDVPANGNLGVPPALARKPARSTPIEKLQDSQLICEAVTVKRGRGRPPKNKKTFYTSSDGGTVAASMTVIAPQDLVQAGRDAGHACSQMAEVPIERAMDLVNSLNGGIHRQDGELSSTVFRRKRGRPPRARAEFKTGMEMLSNLTSVRVDQVDKIEGDHVRASLDRREANVVDHSRMSSPRQTRRNGELPSGEDSKVGEMDTAIRKTTRSMEEVRTPSLWLVEGNGQVLTPDGSALPTEGIHKAAVPERHFPNDFLPLVVAGPTAVDGGTRTYERRRSKLSPTSQRETYSTTEGEGEESESERTDVHSSFYGSYTQLLAAAGPSVRSGEVMVPIRYFPGVHQRDAGRFIPVETIVVNDNVPRDGSEHLGEASGEPSREPLDASLNEVLNHSDEAVANVSLSETSAVPIDQRVNDALARDSFDGALTITGDEAPFNPPASDDALDEVLGFPIDSSRDALLTQALAIPVSGPMDDPSGDTSDEPLDEVLIPAGQQQYPPAANGVRIGRKLLCKLKWLSKKEASPVAAHDSDSTQQQQPPPPLPSSAPSTAISLPNGGRAVPATPFTVPDPINSEVQRFDQIEQGKRQPPDPSSMGGPTHGIPVTVS